MPLRFKTIARVTGHMVSIERDREGAKAYALDCARQRIERVSGCEAHDFEETLSRFPKTGDSDKYAVIWSKRSAGVV